MSVIESGLSTVDALAAATPPRRFDEYILGPFLIWAALQKKPLGKWTRKTLFVAGAFTVIYNWKKYRSL